MNKQTKNLGLAATVAGIGVIVFAVLLVGLTREGGGLDWVSIITAIAGFVMTGTGLFTLYRSTRSGPGSDHPSPHGAS